MQKLKELSGRDPTMRHQTREIHKNVWFINGRGLKISHVSRLAANGGGYLFSKNCEWKEVGRGPASHTCSFPDLLPPSPDTSPANPVKNFCMQNLVAPPCMVMNCANVDKAWDNWWIVHHETVADRTNWKQKGPPGGKGLIPISRTIIRSPFVLLRKAHSLNKSWHQRRGWWLLHAKVRLLIGRISTIYLVSGVLGDTCNMITTLMWQGLARTICVLFSSASHTPPQLYDHI